jgi:hypothetical protein
VVAPALVVAIAPVVAPAQVVAPPPKAQVDDPTNDATSWTQFEDSKKRKYWHNTVLDTSTYDKPLCLKTVRERCVVIHCKWKEYTNDGGKKYYSNGNESVSSAPEEYRAWKRAIWKDMLAKDEMKLNSVQELKEICKV